MYIILLSILGCNGTEEKIGVLPDFLLEDVNTTSQTYQQQISPRDYLGQVSVWYFGHST